MKTEYVILTDENDQPVGTAEKMEAHQKGLLHRAFSVVITDLQGRILLQQRADHKYHCGGLWTNTCCSHPAPNETTEAGAKRRLKEEMGIETELKFLYRFVYRAEFDNGLIEHESDHVFFGKTDQQPSLNPDEVKDFIYVSWQDLEQDIARFPEKYTIWFRLMLLELKSRLSEI